MLVPLLLLTLAIQPFDYKKWLDEDVRYVISSRERSEFKALQTTEDRQRFVHEFWRRRDPDPSTVVNEFREQHYRRIQEANQRFDREGRPGWRTSRGRALIIHGPPDNVSYYFGNQQVVTVRNPTDLLNRTGTLLPFIDVQFPAPESETWTYRTMPSSKVIRGNFSVIFAKMDPNEMWFLQNFIRRTGQTANIALREMRDRAILSFITNKTYMRNDYRIVYAGEPRFQDLADLFGALFDGRRTQTISQFDVIQATSDLEKSSGEIIEERMQRRSKMEEMVSGRVFFGRLPVDVGYGFLRSYSGHVNIPINVSLALDSPKPPAYIDLYAELIHPETGIPVVGFQDRISPKTKKGFSGTVSYQSRLGAAPGSYKFRVVVSEIENKKIGIWEEMIEVPALTSEGFGASELVICERVMTKDEYRNESATKTHRDWISYSRQNPLLLDDWVFVPAAEPSFRRLQTMTTLLEVYNPTMISKEPSVEVQARCLRDGSIVALTDVKELDYMTGKDKDIIVYAISIALKTLDPGDYDFVVSVIDKPTGESIEKRASFKIL